MELTAIIKKGIDGYFVALCPEVDVASQGKSIDEALKNLKEAVELYVEEFGLPDEISSTNIIVANFEVENNGKAPGFVRQ